MDLIVKLSLKYPGELFLLNTNNTEISDEIQ